MADKESLKKLVFALPGIDTDSDDTGNRSLKTHIGLH